MPNGVWKLRDRGGITIDGHARFLYHAGMSKVLLVSARPNRGVFAWDGSNWTFVAEPANALFMQGAAYDEGRDRVVLFGGLAADSVGADNSRSTWLFEDGAWRELTARGPAAGGGAALAYDAVRSVIVLIGGAAHTNDTPRGETWLFDGEAWTKAMSAESPASQYAGIAYDAARELVVLVRPVSGEASETWEWDGASWEHIEAATPLPYAYQCWLTYDGGLQRVVSLVEGALWDWDGNTWARVDGDDGREAERGTSPIVYDAARSRLVAHRAQKSTWEHDGTAWQEIPPSRPTARQRAASIYDAARDRIVYFGAVSDPDDATWEWDGRDWIRGPRAASATPSGLAMAYDSKRGRAVMIVDASTWEYDGETWTNIAAAPGFASRLAYDEARSVTVALVGAATWTWDGRTWRDTMTAGPTVVRDGSMAYDAARERIVSFGGYIDGSGGSQIDETWEWDGSTWTRMSPTVSPSARGGHALAYDSRRRRIVMYGGYRHNEIWEYDGFTWTQRKIRTAPSGSFSNGLVYDSERDRMVFYASNGALWEYYPVGDVCASNDECASGSCVDGVCCDRACTASCEACSIESGAAADGICEVLPDAGAACVSSEVDGGAAADPDGGVSGRAPPRRQGDGCTVYRDRSAAGGGLVALGLLLAIIVRRRCTLG